MPIEVKAEELLFIMGGNTFKSEKFVPQITHRVGSGV